MDHHPAIGTLASPRRTELEQHCRRVAAWAVELARTERLGSQSRELLRAAALAHHYPSVLLDSCARPKLLADLGLIEPSGPPAITGGVAEILKNMCGRERTGGVAAKLGLLLEMADALDEWLESEPIRGADEDAAPEGLAGQAAAALRVVGDLEASGALENLPVVPKIAHQVLAALRSEDWNGARIESLASSDPVLAGHLIQCANNCAYSATRPITTVSRALLQVGETAARRVLVAACLRPAFASPPLYRLWNHSLAAAEAAEQLAAACGQCDPSEAFLAGLVHDVGHLALLRLGNEFHVRLARLIEGGCDSVSAEQVLCGMSHAEIGALITRGWRFPDRLSAAVRDHHRPESFDAIAAILYLAEECTRASEHRPSTLRLYRAFDTLKLMPADLRKIEGGRSKDLAALRFAA